MYVFDSRFYCTKLITISFLLLLTACAKPGDDPASPDQGVESQLQPFFKAEIQDDGTTQVFASFTIESEGIESPEQSLYPWGEELWAEAIGSKQMMTEQPGPLGGVYYSTTFATDAELTDFRVSFYRYESVAATNSNVALPLDYEIAAPNTGQVIDRKEELMVLWEPPRPEKWFVVSLSVYCFDPNNQIQELEQSWTMLDTGSLTINFDTLLSSSGVSSAEGWADSCDGLLTFRRYREGELDPAFIAGGGIRSLRKKYRSFSISGV